MASRDDLQVMKHKNTKDIWQSAPRARRGVHAGLVLGMAAAACLAWPVGCLSALGDFGDGEYKTGSSSSGTSTGSSSSSTGMVGADGGTAGMGGMGGGAAGVGGMGGMGGMGGAGGTGGTAPTCPNTAEGPAMVMVDAPDPKDAYCIDGTEVTVTHYKEFMDAMVDPATQINECKAWNNTFAPESISGFCNGFDLNALLMNEPNRPITCIDFCDAYAYCAWAGKRLCGKIGGAKLPYNDTGKADQSQWYRACSTAGTTAYPYGNTYMVATCVDPDYDGTPGYNAATDIPKEVGSAAGCVGGYPGLFDMSGNVWEWEDACNGTNGIGDNCRRRGGSCASLMGELACISAPALTRESTSRVTGIRCCADLP